MRKGILNALLGSLFMDGLTGREAPTQVELRSQPKKKSCLYCGKTHKHNNSFCSSAHAKLWNKGERL